MKYAIQALLEYLVDPALPTKSSVPVTPSQSEQESVAKQVLFLMLPIIDFFSSFLCAIHRTYVAFKKMIQYYSYAIQIHL